MKAKEVGGEQITKWLQAADHSDFGVAYRKMAAPLCCLEELVGWGREFRIRTIGVNMVDELIRWLKRNLFPEDPEWEMAIRPKVQRWALFASSLALVSVPLVAWVLHDCPIQRAISSYYYTGAHDLFVGLFFAIGFFLLSYRGTTRFDNHYSTLTGVSAVGIGICPPNSEKVTCLSAFEVTPLIPGIPYGIHAVMTVAFLIQMVGLALRFAWEARCRRRIVGLYMILALVMVAGGLGILRFWNAQGPEILICESFIILAFAAAWAMKAIQTGEDQSIVDDREGA